MFSTERAAAIADRVETFVRETVVPYEQDQRCGFHGPSDDLVVEMRAKAREAGVLTPHILSDGSHLTQRETAKGRSHSRLLLTAAGKSLEPNWAASVRINLNPWSSPYCKPDHFHASNVTASRIYSWMLRCFYIPRYTGGRLVSKRIFGRWSYVQITSI